MITADAFIPYDRRLALTAGYTLPQYSRGAVLFADISGFSALTETLVMQLGPGRGAQELSRQINRVYTALIAQVHRFGGSIINFSGDAVTCWFAGDDGRGAVAAGIAMQQAMAQPVLAVSVKIAITAGPARRFMVGDPAIQTLEVLAGDTVNRAAAADSLARPGEILVSAEIFDQWEGAPPPLEWRQPQAGLRLGVINPTDHLAQPAINDGGARPVVSPHIARPWLLLPVFQQLQSGPVAFLAEIRPVVALFLGFEGLDYDRDPLACPKLDAYINWVQHTLQQHTGYLIQLTHGDKGSYLYAVFGALQAHDDDPVRAIAAALALQQPPARLQFIRRVRLGLSRGRAWAGMYGSPARLTYGVLGNHINLAARLMEQARPGQILMSQPLADATREAYVFDAPSTLLLKGWDHPVNTVAVRSRRPLRSQAANKLPGPVVGREPETRQLRQFLLAAAGGQGQVIRVTGPAGIGKSSLAAVAAEQAAAFGFLIAVGASQLPGQAVPFLPWRQILRALLDIDSNLPPAEQINRMQAAVQNLNAAWLPRLPLLVDWLDLPIADNNFTATLNPKLRHGLRLALVIDIIMHLARGAPLLLLVEDAHRLDEASRELTQKIAAAVEKSAVVLLLTERPGIGPPPSLQSLPGYSHLPLAELAAPAIKTVAQNRLAGNISGLALEIIQNRSQGNPFFIEEVLSTLVELGHLARRSNEVWDLTQQAITALQSAHCLTRAGSGWRLRPQARWPEEALELPDSIHRAILARLDRLPYPHRLTIKVAGVIGPVVPVDLLAAAHPALPEPAEWQAQLETLAEQEVFRLESAAPRVTYRFKHQLIQEVAYSTLVDDQQRHLHGQVGLALETAMPEAVELLAYHFSRSAVPDKALLYLERAAQKNQRDYAAETALHFYGQALARDERPAWLAAQAELLHILGRRAEEKEVLLKLAARPALAPLEVALLWSQYYEATGNYPAAEQVLQQALNTNPGGSQAVQCLAQLGLIARRRGNYESARGYYRQAQAAISLNAQPAPDNVQQQLTILNGLGAVLRQQGLYDEARHSYLQALTTSRGHGYKLDEAEALNHLGVTAFYQQKLTEAETYHRQALEIRRAIGDHPGEGTSLYNLAVTLRDHGDYSQVQPYLLEALEIQRLTGNRWEEVNILNGLGGFFMLMGDLPQAQTAFEQGLAISQAINDEAGQAFLLCNLGWVAYAQDNLPGAQTLLTTGLSLAQSQSDHDLTAYLLSYLSLVNLAADQLDEAARQAKNALAIRQQLEQHTLTSGVLATLAKITWGRGNLPKAVAYARQSTAILDGCGGYGAEFPAQDYFFCYQVFTAAGKKREAAQALQSAYAQLMRRADKIPAPAVRESFLGQPLNRQIVTACAALSPAT